MTIYTVTEDELTNTADAIRTKAGTTAELEWEQENGFKEVIEAIPYSDVADIYAQVSPPTSPNDGDIFIDISDSIGIPECKLFVAQTSPQNANEGDLWVDTASS